MTNDEREMRDAARAMAESRDPDLARVGRRIQSRTCGPCKLCCVVKTVRDYAPAPKPAGVACPSLCGRGCGVYKTRPNSCREYLCAWRGGFGGSAARLDRCGVIVDLHVLDNGVPSLTIQATRGGFDSRVIAEIVDDAMRVGIHHVAFAGRDDDLDGASFRYESDEHVLARALVAFSADGVAPPGFVLPRERESR